VDASAAVDGNPAHPAEGADATPGEDAPLEPDATDWTDAAGEAGSDASAGEAGSDASAGEAGSDASAGEAGTDGSGGEDAPMASDAADAAGQEAAAAGCGANCPTSAVSTYSCAKGGCNAAGGACTAAATACYCTADSECASGKCLLVSGQNDVSCGSNCTGAGAADGFDCTLAAPGIPASCAAPVFGYKPSNFVPGGYTPPATSTTINCSPTYNSTTHAFTSWCAGQTAPTIASDVAQASGPNLDILAFRSLTVTSGNTLTLTGNNAVILAVYGDASIQGTITAAGAAGAWNVVPTVTTTSATPSSSNSTFVASNVYDGSASTYWSSATHGSAGNTEWLAYWWTGMTEVNYVALLPRYNGNNALGFPVTFDIYYSNPSSWVLAATYTSYPTPSTGGWVYLPLPGTFWANGIQIVASTLGADGGKYAFEVAEAQAGGPTSGPGGAYSCGASVGNPPATNGHNNAGGGGASSGTGGAGGADGSGNAGGVASTARANASLVPLYGGCPGGYSGDCGGRAGGGGGGGAVQISAAGVLSVSGTISAQGGAGGSGTNSGCGQSSGGAGGGSGGAVLLEGQSVSAALGNTVVTGGAGGAPYTYGGAGAGGSSGTPNGGTGATNAGGGTAGAGGGGGYGYLKTNTGAQPAYACPTTLSPAPVCNASHAACLCVADADCPSGKCANVSSQCGSNTCTGSTTAGTYDGADCALLTSAASAWSCSAGNCDNVASPGGACGGAGLPCWCTSDAQCTGGLCMNWAGCAAGACTGSGTPDAFDCVW
jgi:hypothetical protein